MLLKNVLKTFILAVLLVISANFVHAETAEEIRSKIADNNKKIEDLQNQINQYSTLLNSTSKEAQTLKSALATLQLTQKKLEANLTLTATKISKTTVTLYGLNQNIKTAEDKIDKSTEAIAQNIRNVSVEESQSIIEQFLQNKSLSQAFDYINALQTFQGRVRVALDDLKDLHADLSKNRDQVAGEKAKLVSYQKNLSDQQKVVISTKETKDKLLSDTKNKESTYKTILAEKQKEKDVYEKELFEFESKLKIIIDPNSIPGARLGVLSWPLDNISITQYFGKTVAASRLYVSGTHGGVDLRASIGTPVKAALSGTVTDTEAVKAKSGCQYGKYILIKHPNGLSTVYGHLSLVSVRPGDTVVTGDIIGYSGDTGYSTGPHLHFGLYATAGVKIVDSSAVGSARCAGIKTVAAPPTAYLDPMAYLPSL